jgi:CheY-like chemotaxis protein
MSMPENHSAGPLTVLVIDDDPVMIELLTLVLSLQGHTLLTADSGEAGLDMVAAPDQPLDVVLTDLQLPGLRGPELAAAIRKVLKAPTLLLGMSGTMPSPGDHAVFDAFLMKPFTVEDFAAAVARAKAGERVGADGNLETADEEGEGVLDENIFARMAAQLNPEQMRQLYDLTVNDMRRRLSLIRGFEAAGDDDGVRREAHALKGGCGMVGAAEIYRMAAQKEAGSPPDTPPLADFDAACDRLRRMLDKRL